MDLPAGHERDEAKREVADELQEEIEKRQAQDGIEPIDASKLAQRDNEILGQLDAEGFIPIQNQEPGKRYVFLTVADGYPEQAQSNIRRQHTRAEHFRFKPVQGADNPVAQNLIGGGRASGTTLRGVGDTVLFEQRLEDEEQMIAYHQHQMDKDMAIEENSVVFAQKVLGSAQLPNTMHAARGDFGSDPLLRHVAGAAGHSETFAYDPNRTNFTEGDLRRGSLKGPDGRPIQPGYEARRYR
jgi:hypothetical protein